jgi:hypothetical protein
VKRGGEKMKHKKYEDEDSLVAEDHKMSCAEYPPKSSFMFHGKTVNHFIWTNLLIKSQVPVVFSSDFGFRESRYFLHAGKIQENSEDVFRSKEVTSQKIGPRRPSEVPQS